MNENNTNTKKRTDLALKVFLIFGAVMILLCFFIFIFNYDIAFDDHTDGGFIPPSFAIVFYYFMLAVTAIVIALFIKVVFKNRVSFSILFAASILIPIFSYNINRMTLDEGGPFHFLVDEGGIFHFIAIKDFNFDGINDEEYHLMYETRTVGSENGGSPTDKIIKSIITEATGVGMSLGAFSTYDEKNRQITLHLQKDNVVYEKIEMIIEFYDPNDIKPFNMSLISKNHFGKMLPIDYQIHCEYQTNEDNTLSIILDAEDCLTIQNNSENEYIEIVFSFSVF